MTAIWAVPARGEDPPPPSCPGQWGSAFGTNTSMFTLSCTGSGLTYAPDPDHLPAHGTLGPISGDQTTYTPTAPFDGIDTFDVLVTDSLGRTATDTINVRLSSRTPAPPVTRRPPTVQIIAPVDGTVVDTATLTVRGTTTYHPPLTVNGQPVALDAAGNWSTSVTLQPGLNHIVAQATNAAGSVSAQIAVSYVPPVIAPGCRVPRLKGLTLKAAKRALRRAHCTVGAVTRRVSRKVRRGRVISSRPGAGRRTAPGGPVRLKVSKGPG
jgi:hypothetical protein